jgi:hypothetical protein
MIKNAIIKILIKYSKLTVEDFGRIYASQITNNVKESSIHIALKTIKLIIKETNEDNKL